MRNCRLTVFAVNGKKVAEAPLSLAQLPGSGDLDQLYRAHVHGRRCRYAVIREGNAVRCLFLAKDLLPKRANKLGVRARIPGRWATSSLNLGHGTDAIVGPGLFFRLVDLERSEQWMEPVLQRFTSDIRVRTRQYGGQIVKEWRSYDQLHCMVLYRGRRRLFGAGNTPEALVEERLQDHAPSSVEDYLWAVGAVSMD